MANFKKGAPKVKQSFEQARESMVEGQVRPNKVTDEALLGALRLVPREKFLPPRLSALAYVDDDIAIGNGRYMVEPMIIARLLQAARIQPDDAALDIGCGGGYATAVMSRLCASVTGIDSDAELAATAAKTLAELRCDNAEIMAVDHMRNGYTEKEPYDVILINGAVSSIPDGIKQQLALDGRLVSVLARGNDNRVGTAIVMTRHEGGFSVEDLFEATTPFLAEFEPPRVFKFPEY
jgi:protein-L-isoaspartate(D-aspartate) O-methyltransferase